MLTLTCETVRRQQPVFIAAADADYEVNLEADDASDEFVPGMQLLATVLPIKASCLCFWPLFNV
jgi:hypothetical protein